MALNEQERQAARNAQWFSGGKSFGRGDKLCPIGQVAQCRGAKFRRSRYGWLNEYILPKDATTPISDVIEWLGFPSFEAFLLALPKERERIFERATY